LKKNPIPTDKCRALSGSQWPGLFARLLETTAEEVALPMAGSPHRAAIAASIFSNWRRRRRGSVSRAISRSSPTTRCTTRSSQWLCGLRGGGRSRDRLGRDHPLRRRRRCRTLHQPADRARPEPWRHRPGSGPGDVGGTHDRPGIGTAGMRVGHGLRDAALGQPAVLRDRDCRGAVADQPVWHQGRRRRRLYPGARGRAHRFTRRINPRNWMEAAI
jgi:hypothetical protein